MNPTVRTLALSGLLALGGPAYVGAQAAPPASVEGPGSDVPYVAQGPLLCGGASAAMVERFWGELGVYAADYEALVDRAAGGIHTDDLADALQHRGYRVRVVGDAPVEALEQVRAGVPVIALLESGKSRYHYVVVVAVGPDAIRVHDPLLRPGHRISRDRFMRRWAASGYWALAALPARERPGGQGAPEVGPDPSAPDSAKPDPATPDSTASDAVARDSLPPLLRSALAALRADSVDAAAVRVERYLQAEPGGGPHRPLALEMLATARYLAGDELGALAAWNRDGGPPVDLVRVSGLDALRYRTVAEPLGLAPGDVLTPRRLRLARRRLLQLPSVRTGRVGYQPLRNGAVRVDAAVMERARAPLAPLELAAIGLGAAVNQRMDVVVGPVLPVGERWRVRVGWEGARPLGEGVVAVPWPPLASVATVRGGWLEERFANGTARERTWGGLAVQRWIGPSTRLGGGAGVERWQAGRVGRIGASVLVEPWEDRLRLATAVDGWAGAGNRAARVRAGARLRLEASPYRAWSARIGATLASHGAPPFLWDGAGVGRVRSPLLRGHPLIRDDRVGRDAFGRALVHGTAAHAWFVRAGPVRAELKVFVDAARVWRPLVDQGPRSYLDPGIELAVTEARRTVAISLARGDRWVLAARVSPTADVLPAPVAP